MTPTPPQQGMAEPNSRPSSPHWSWARLPKRVLTLDSLQPTVYRVQRGRARRVALTVGVTDNTVVEVLSGVSAGDQVVVVGQDKLLEDTVVHVVADD